MNYNVEIIKQESYKPTFWSGGMATELVTYPLNSDYASRNFLWRLGIAKIDVLESTFSDLPNISRKFMVIGGKITLDHENKYIKLLNSFDQDSFGGDWKTKTHGKAFVFNLMTKENYNGQLIHLDISPKKQITFKYETSLDKEIVTICFYIVNGNCISVINNKVFKINRNDLLMLNCITPRFIHEITFSSDSLEVTHLIASVIYRS